MNQQYYEAVTKMEEMKVDPEYIQGWQGGYLLNPEREEQRVTEAYSQPVMKMARPTIRTTLPTGRPDYPAIVKKKGGVPRPFYSN